MKRTTKRRVSVVRRPRINATLQVVATSMLDHAQSLFDKACGLDTDVRDIVSEGLASIVHAAYDTQAIAQCVNDFDHVAYIQTRTYEWFRERGFVEWFCAGASTNFQTSPRSFFRIKTAKAKSGKAVVFSREKVS